MWPGYQGKEVEFGVSLRDGNKDVYVWQVPDALKPASTDAKAKGPQTGAPPSAWLEKTDGKDGKSKRVAKAVDPRSLIGATAYRNGGKTVYEMVVDWRLIPDFKPAPRKSLGISLVVNDVDKGIRRSAEYGSGIIRAKRTTDFAAIRLCGK
jgi:hypothetical protein